MRDILEEYLTLVDHHMTDLRFNYNAGDENAMELYKFWEKRRAVVQHTLSKLLDSQGINDTEK